MWRKYCKMKKGQMVGEDSQCEPNSEPKVDLPPGLGDAQHRKAKAKKEMKKWKKSIKSRGYM